MNCESRKVTLKDCFSVLMLGLTLLVAAPAVADIRVVDGDTIERDGETIRIYGIDASRPVNDVQAKPAATGPAVVRP